VIWVGIDESGTHDGAQALTIAACVGTATEWQRFKDAWAPFAKKYERKGYHATKASDSDNRVLGRLMCEHLSAALAFRTPYAASRALVSSDLRSQVGNEYTLAVRIVVDVLAHIAAQNDVDWISYLIEDGHPGAARTKQEFEQKKALRPGDPFRKRVYSDTWVGKEELITHPADLLSYEWGTALGRESSTPNLDLFRAQEKFHLTDYKPDDMAEAVRQTVDTLKAFRRAKAFLKKKGG
jgi:hypothetical protein